MDSAIKKRKNNSADIKLTDLHTHILPAFDDGAESIEIALRMLLMQKENGIERVALTPHFYPFQEELGVFLARRQRAYTELMSRWDDEIMPHVCLGAEVHYSPALLQMDLRCLTIGDGNFLLLELPDKGIAPCLDQVIEDLLGQGIVPIIAHIDRCEVFRHEPDRLYNLIQMGALAQIDVGALIKRKRDKFAVMCLNKGLAHLIASDMHNLSNRRNLLSDIVTGDNMEYLCYTEMFARAIWDKDPLPSFSVKKIQKSWMGYR